MMRFRLPRMLGAVLLAATIGASGLAIATPTTQASGGVSPSKLGMYVGYDQGGRFADMERRLELPIKWVLTMADKRSPQAMISSAWGQLAKTDAYLPKVSGRVNLVMSVPVGFGEGGLYNQVGGRDAVRRNLLDVASGKHDGAYRAVARYLIEAGYGDAVLRLGHEFDGTYEPYSARDNNDAYIAAYRRVHDVFESESASFKFEWTSMRAYFRQYGPPAYPGDRYVDIVGLDIYYREPGPISDQVWTNQYRSVLVAHRDFAVSRGKPVAYSEWGRAKADEARYVGLMHGWFSSLADQGPGGLVYQSYFNETWADYDLAKLPVVRKAYVDLFGRAGVTTSPTAPAPTPPPTTAPPTTAPAAVPPPTTAPAPAPTTTTAPAPTTTTPVVPPVGLAPAERLTVDGAAVTTKGTATTPTVTLTPSARSLQLNWSHPLQARANVRYRAVGTTSWIWVPNGSRTQQLAGLAPNTTYEVQVRMYLWNRWQDWTTVRATTSVTSGSALTSWISAVVAAAKGTSISLVPKSSALELTWFHPDAGLRNVRFRTVGSTAWTWVPNGSWNQVISGLRSRTDYEVQVRAYADGMWQPWAKAMATTY